MTTTSVSLGRRRLFVAAGNRLVARAWQLWRALIARKQVMTLLEADDRMLADIGLTRSDVIGSLQLPMDADPSHHLIRARADHRRSRSRRAS